MTTFKTANQNVKSVNAAPLFLLAKKVARD